MSQKHRYVLQICHSYYDPFLDCARQYAALFKDTDIRVVTVFLSGEENHKLIAKTDSDEVIFLGYQSKQLTGLKLNIIRDIRRIASRYEFEFCIAHRIKPTYVALLATSLQVLSVQHTFGCFDRFSRRMLVNLFKSRVTLLAVSNALRDEIRSHLKNWPDKAIQTLHNHIQVDSTVAELLPRTEARNALQLLPESWIIGTVGRLHPDKDQHTLISAFALARHALPDHACLVIVGQGRLEKTLKAQCAALDITDQVIFTGPLHEARRFFRAFDLFVLTSDREPFGMVLLEAMAAKLPIICSDCGGGGEIVQPIGHLFPFGNAKALAKTLVQFNKERGQASPESLDYLKKHFSDEAISAHFWQASYTQPFLIDKKA